MTAMGKRLRPGLEDQVEIEVRGTPPRGLSAPRGCNGATTCVYDF